LKIQFCCDYFYLGAGMFSFIPKHRKQLVRLLIPLIIISTSLTPILVRVEATAGSEIDPFAFFNNENITSNNILLNREGIITEGWQVIDKDRIKTFDIEIPQLDQRERKIIVYLPSDYISSNSSYPVLYLQDAQKVFFQSNDQKWYSNDKYLKFFTNNQEKESIIIGVMSDPIHIWDEYSPWVNDDMYLWMDPYDANRIQGGEGDVYLEFLIQTLKPIIDKNYRTNTDRENTAIGGHDMGGLISLYAALTMPEIYSKVFALSPAVWFAEEGGVWLSRNRLLNLIETTVVPQEVSFIIDVAEEERTTENEVRPAVNDSLSKKISFPQAYLEGTRAVTETLLNEGLPKVNINHGEFNLDAWSGSITSLSSTESRATLKNYFPLFMKQGLDHFDIFIPFHNRNRRVWVYLPPDYSKSNTHYPVIYFFDAQHTFGSETGAYISKSTDWLLDEKLDEIYYETGQGIIAVAMEFDATHPFDEYMPWDHNYMKNWLDSYPARVTGKGDLLIDFVITELKPLIDARYRTLQDRENTCIGGGSRVALLSLYAGLVYPETFSKVLAMSPAIWLAEGSNPYLQHNNMKSLIRAGVPADVKFFLYIGGNENSGPPPPYPYAFLRNGTKLTMPQVYFKGAYMVRTEILTKLGFSSTLEYVYREFGVHSPSIWRIYLKSAFDWLGLY